MQFHLITSLYVFMLAAFIGFEVIRRVSPLLHTPLMSLTNALDAIAVVGAIDAITTVRCVDALFADLPSESQHATFGEAPFLGLGGVEGGRQEGTPRRGPRPGQVRVARSEVLRPACQGGHRVGGEGTVGDAAVGQDTERVGGNRVGRLAVPPRHDRGVGGK